MNVHYTGVTVYNVGSRDFLKFFTQWARILNQHFTHLPINLWYVHRGCVTKFWHL